MSITAQVSSIETVGPVAVVSLIPRDKPHPDSVGRSKIFLYGTRLPKVGDNLWGIGGLSGQIETDDGILNFRAINIEMPNGLIWAPMCDDITYELWRTCKIVPQELKDQDLWERLGMI